MNSNKSYTIYEIYNKRKNKQIPFKIEIKKFVKHYFSKKIQWLIVINFKILINNII